MTPNNKFSNPRGIGTARKPVSVELLNVVDFETQKYSSNEQLTNISLLTSNKMQKGVRVRFLPLVERL